MGVESATVVGPAGEEIHTDELGRVRVHFHWDRESQMNEKSSCWIHVSQSWGGAGYGGVNLPRVGQEVLVDFLGGDPDRPIITGRVYTNLQKVPYPLPANKTQSGWRSNSTNATGGYNEVMFEDASGQELLRMQAEKDMHKLVKNDEESSVGRDRTRSVKRNESVSVWKSRTKEIAENEQVTIGQNQRVAIGVNRSTEVGNLDVTRVPAKFLTRTLEMLLPNSHQSQRLIVRVGIPERDPLPGGDFRVRVEIEGLEKPHSRHIHGVDEIQALLEGCWIVPHLVEGLTPRGAKVTWLGSDDLGFGMRNSEH